MPRPDPVLLDPARYPFSEDIETRFSDLDLNQHINNVAMINLLEEGRVRFHRASGYHRPGIDVAFMVVSLSAEFIGQGHVPDPVTMHLGTARLGTSSYALDQLATQGDRVIAYSHAVMVCVRGDRPTPVPDLLREGLEAWAMRA